MDRCLGVYIVEYQNFIVFINYFRGYFFVNYFTKNAKSVIMLLRKFNIHKIMEE